MEALEEACSFVFVIEEGDCVLISIGDCYCLISNGRVDTETVEGMDAEIR